MTNIHWSIREERICRSGSGFQKFLLVTVAARLLAGKLTCGGKTDLGCPCARTNGARRKCERASQRWALGELVCVLCVN